MKTEGDVLLQLAAGYGEVEFVGGQPRMDGGLQTALLISLFGGNKEDDGNNSQSSVGWWGNIDEKNPAARVVSRFQALMYKIPLLPSTLRRIQTAVEADLAWFKSEKIVSEIVVELNIAAPKQLDMKIKLFGSEDETAFQFLVNWTDFNTD